MLLSQNINKKTETFLNNIKKSIKNTETRDIKILLNNKQKNINNNLNYKIKNNNSKTKSSSKEIDNTNDVKIKSNSAVENEVNTSELYKYLKTKDLYLPDFR